MVRTIDLSKLEKNEPVTVMLSADVNMKLMLIRVPKEHDLVRSLSHCLGGSVLASLADSCSKLRRNNRGIPDLSEKF